jgi:predicted acylesterase/phospholipase RssA
MSDPNTIRILSFDGGGERGYLSLNFFSRFVNQWGIDPATIASQFDVITGNSVGGIIALGLAFGMTPEELLPFFTVQGPYIFSLSSLIPSLRPNLAAKLALIASDIPFYQSSGPTANSYGSGLLAATLVNTFGSNTLQDLKTNVVIPSYQNDNSTYVLFSNYNAATYIGQNELISNVALATSAAPIYLPSASFNNHIYLDGAVYMNNPADFGRVLAQTIKPTANRTCILSIGTGLGEMGFDPGNPDILDQRVIDQQLIIQNNLRLFDSIATIFALYDIAATGGQESIAKSLSIESQSTLSPLYYYRFQPMLDQDLNTELDNTDPEILSYYETVAANWYQNDHTNITNFLAHLTI